MLASILAALPDCRRSAANDDDLPPRRERMSRVDTAWLRMDNDVNLMMIVGVWLLEPAIALRRRCAGASRTSC